MAGMGPARKPDDKRARTNTPVIAGVRRLPAEGRKGQQPGWPLAADIELTTRRNIARENATRLQEELEWKEGRQRMQAEKAYTEAEEKRRVLDAELKFARERERKLWNDLWRTPQACAWEQLGWTREVAIYVRLTVRAEQGSLPHTQEARQYADRLGLSPMAMRRLGWEVVQDEVGQKRERSSGAAAAGAASARARRGPLTSVPATGT